MLNAGSGRSALGVEKLSSHIIDFSQKINLQKMVFIAFVNVVEIRRSKGGKLNEMLL